MARTFDEILDSIRTRYKNNLTMQEKYGFDPDKTWDEQVSAVSFESQLTYVIASAFEELEQHVDEAKQEISDMIAANHQMVTDWAKRQFLAFQYGDTLVFDEELKKFVYPVIDESKQIIKHVALRNSIVNNVTTLQVFVAKENKVALTADELAAFELYAKTIFVPGTHFEFISLAPNQLEVNVAIIYNPQLLDGNGLLLSDGSNPVEQAVTAYLDGIRYSGKFNRTRQTDAMQLATGVLDVVLGDVKIDTSLNNAQSFDSPSGFFALNNIVPTYTPGSPDDY